MTGIYIIRNVASGKHYVGSSVKVNKRLCEHRWMLNHQRHQNAHLQRAWAKDGKDLFVFEIFLTCDKQDLLFYEQAIIDAFIDSCGRKTLYNINLVAGSTEGRPCSAATRRIHSRNSRGRWTGRKHTEETKRRISLANIGKNTGKHPTDEARRKMSEYRKGRKFTEEHKRKIALAIMGHKKSPETIEKLRLASTGRRHTEETKRKIGDASRGKPGTRLGIKNKRPYPKRRTTALTV